MSTLDSFIRRWSTTPASNGVSPNVAPYGWQEGMAPSEVNDTARQNMTDHRYQWEDAEWFCWGDTVSKNGSATIMINGVDATTRYLANRRLKVFADATRYATIVSSAYSAPDTKVICSFDSGSVGTSCTAVALGIVSPTSLATPPVTLGTKTNDNAVAGNVGEEIQSVVAAASAVSLTTNTAANVTSISLTKGDWIVWGNVGLATASVASTLFLAWISSTSATAPDQSLYNSFTGTLPAGCGLQAPYKRFKLTTTTTVYLSTFSTFAGTATACGFISATRIR